MTFYPDSLTNIIEARGLNIEAVASATGISHNTLRKSVESGHTPTKNQVFKLSHTLAVPAYAFFMEGFKISDPSITDFRSSTPKPMKFGRNSNHFVRVFELRNFLAELFIRLDLDPPQTLIAEQLDENPEQFAAAIGRILGIDSIRAESKTKKDFYRSFRDSVENLGVFTVQDHYFSDEIDGFALYHDNFSSNLIYINSSKRNHGVKSFTLAHELAHILGKRSAISDNYQRDNDVERFCNVFAASLLLPRDKLYAMVEKRKLTFGDYDSAINAAEAISQEFKTSISASLVRTAELGLSKWEYYQTFAKGFGSANFLDAIKPRGGGGSDEGPEPGIVDLAFLGRRAVSIITKGIQQKVTTEYEIFKRTGLSKKRIEGLIHISNKENLAAQ
ncbi:ImmA/IrrE family metallo-endopeptidase [Rhizobium wenxiniae]|uniref:helix-turn-helix domain-containing protein n=1 Tax=Rhizobium wenxiniae TaxID=1737357 RepID=UPI001C6E73B5|nr:ImmA/IrrE family metallo-endopeptidase [Rhizobium wenxiniae]MBW9090305.1 ImmA/IrrE family metallo-endopeptidase [Rhizobium wenxiniae]